MHNDHNILHPELSHRNRAWHPIPDPFAPSAPQQAYTHTLRHIFIQADQLFYDIDAVTALVDRSSRNRSAPETAVATSESDTYRPLFFRWFDRYIAYVENSLSAFVMKPERIARIDSLAEWDEREITLRMPTYWDATAYDPLVQAIHQYIVSGALYEYFSLTLTAADPRTSDRYRQINELADTIRALACRVIPGSVHKHLKPF